MPDDTGVDTLADLLRDLPGEVDGMPDYGAHVCREAATSLDAKDVEIARLKADAIKTAVIADVVGEHISALECGLKLIVTRCKTGEQPSLAQAADWLPTIRAIALTALGEHLTGGE